MKAATIKIYVIFSLIWLLLLVIDQSLKFYFLTNSSASVGGDFFSGLVRFDLAKNYGVAFGLVVQPISILVLVAATMIVLGYALIRASAASQLLSVFALGSVLIGALSNFSDRLQYGYVIDYIDVRFFTTFNLADCLITGGLALLLLDAWRRDRIKPKTGLKV